MTIRTGLIKFLSVVCVLSLVAASEASLYTIDFEGVAPTNSSTVVSQQNFTFGEYNVYVPAGRFVDSGAPQVVGGTWADSGSDYLHGTSNLGFTISRVDGGLFDAFSFSASEFLASTSRNQRFRAVGITEDDVVVQFFNTDPTFGFETFQLNSGFRNLISLQILDNQSLIAWDNVTVAAVPEPASMALFGLGGIGLAALARRRQKSVQS